MHPTVPQSLAALLSAFPTADSSDPESTARVYMMAVEDLPPEFVAQAVRRFIRGEVKRDRHTFLPTAPELAVEARKCRDEERGRQYLALPKPKASERHLVSEEERAKVQRMMDDLSEKMAERHPSRRTMNPLRQAPEDFAADLAQFKARLEGITLSESLLKKLGEKSA